MTQGEHGTQLRKLASEQTRLADEQTRIAVTVARVEVGIQTIIGLLDRDG